jgi:hypothetical protein
MILYKILGSSVSSIVLVLYVNVISRMFYKDSCVRNGILIETLVPRSGTL